MSASVSVPDPGGLTPAQRTEAMLKALEEKKRPDPALLAIKPMFERLAEKFPDGQRMFGPAFGLWSLLHKRGQAPLPDEVRESDKGIMAFLKGYQVGNQVGVFA